MKSKYILLIALFLSCSDKSSSTFTDARVCVFNAVPIENQPQLEEAASSSGIQTTVTTEGIVFCSENREIDAVISTGEPKELSEVLATAEAI